MTGYIRILHRDIAARSCFLNINLDSSITAKLGNFEKAKEASDGIYRVSELKLDSVTQRWTAPEVFEVLCEIPGITLVAYKPHLVIVRA